MRISHDMIDHGFADGTCDSCGESSTPHGAVWAGNLTIIELCDRCAAQVLPVMVADAMSHAHPEQVKSLLAEIERQVWRAVAFRIARETERQLIPSEN